MRHPLFYLLGVLAPYWLHSQTTPLTPMFQTTIYVQDAIGNLDSVVLGYDTLANSEFNPDFGEAYLITPFDSVLDVRAAHSLSWNSLTDPTLLSKSIVGWCEKYANVDCFLPEGLMVFVKAKYQPVTFYWDKGYITDYDVCNKYPFMTPDKLSILVDTYDWLHTPGGVRAECMAYKDSCQFFLSPALVPEGEEPFLLKPAVHEVSDSVVGVLIAFAPSYPYSACSLVSAASEPATTAHLPLLLSPNPTNEAVQVSSAGSGLSEVVVYDRMGRLITIRQGLHQETLTLSTADWPPGLYFVAVQRSDQRRTVGRLVKM